jgi:hypothetical protein
MLMRTLLGVDVRMEATCDCVVEVEVEVDGDETGAGAGAEDAAVAVVLVAPVERVQVNPSSSDGRNLVESFQEVRPSKGNHDH